MQNCPLAAVKIHAKQTRDGNNRRYGGRGFEGGEGWRIVDRWRVGQSIRGGKGKMSSWQGGLKSVSAEFAAKKRNGSKGWLVAFPVR